MSNKQYEYAIKRSRKFADEMKKKNQSLDYRTEQRAASPDKAYKDELLGKMGEFLALLGLKNQYRFPGGGYLVDTEIRKNTDKGWNLDLPFYKEDSNFPGVYVKTCSRRTMEWVGDYSWTINLGNTNRQGGRDPILDSREPNLLVALVYMEEPQAREGVVKVVAQWIKLEKYRSPPKKEELKPIKTCLYYKNLLENKTTIEGC